MSAQLNMIFDLFLDRYDKRKNLIYTAKKIKDSIGVVIGFIEVLLSP